MLHLAVKLLLALVSGALLSNSLPHLAKGVTGEPFPSPFAKPPGIGDSPPVTNVLWGSANLFAGAALALRIGLPMGWPGWIATAIGFLALALFAARHFGSVRRR
jgi:hypothetical protein